MGTCPGDVLRTLRCPWGSVPFMIAVAPWLRATPVPCIGGASAGILVLGTDKTGRTARRKASRGVARRVGAQSGAWAGSGSPGSKDPAS
jgi:hypothetical protein